MINLDDDVKLLIKKMPNEYKEFAYEILEFISRGWTYKNDSSLSLEEFLNMHFIVH